MRESLPAGPRFWRVALCAVLASASGALGFHTEMRWIERNGTVDSVIGPDGTVVVFAPGTTHRLRLQYGVFDDGDSPAPAGGFVGWNIGTLDATGGMNTRTPGRLSPFNFAPNPPGNGLPSADPFTSLTAIDNTLGTQSPAWGCGPDHMPLPMPLPVIRGLNTFISIYEITTRTGTTGYSFMAGGNLIVATGWGLIGAPTPPDCTREDIPGSITYAPMTLPPIPFTSSLIILVPAPGPAMIALSAALCAAWRRRRCERHR